MNLSSNRLSEHEDEPVIIAIFVLSLGIISLQLVFFADFGQKCDAPKEEFLEILLVGTQVNSRRFVVVLSEVSFGQGPWYSGLTG